MKVTLDYNNETGLIDVISSGGRLSLSQTELAALYIILRKALGIRGRFLLWKRRKMFSKIGAL